MVNKGNLFSGFLFLSRGFILTQCIFCSSPNDRLFSLAKNPVPTFFLRSRYSCEWWFHVKSNGSQQETISLFPRKGSSTFVSLFAGQRGHSRYFFCFLTPSFVQNSAWRPSPGLLTSYSPLKNLFFLAWFPRGPFLSLWEI